MDSYLLLQKKILLILFRANFPHFIVYGKTHETKLSLRLLRLLDSQVEIRIKRTTFKR